MSHAVCTPSGRRGQSNAEFVLFLTVVLAMVISFAVPGFQAYEIDLAMSATRASLGTFVAANRTLTLGAIGYNVTGNTVTLRPRVYNNGVRLDNAWADAQPARAAAFRALAQMFHQTVPDSTATGVVGFTYNFTINFTN